MSFLCLQFPPKNERKQINLRFHSRKVEIVRSFFGGNIYLKKSFWLFLTFCIKPKLRTRALEYDSLLKSQCNINFGTATVSFNLKIAHQMTLKSCFVIVWNFRCRLVVHSFRCFRNLFRNDALNKRNFRFCFLPKFSWNHIPYAFEGYFYLQ